MMPLAHLAPALALLVQGGAGDPRGIVSFATRAVEHDSVAVVSAAWHARLRRYPRDPAAVLGLATVARLTYDYSRAESLYASLLAPAATCPTPDALYARIGQALAFSASSAFRPAAEWFALAATEAHATGDRVAEAEALVGGAVPRTRTEGPGAAERLLRQAARLIPARQDTLWAAYHLARAQLLVLSSRPEARAEAEAAAALADRAGERRIHSGGLHLIAGDLIRRGEPDSALALYADVIRERGNVRDHAGLATALQWRGYLLRTIGAYGEARHDLSLAVADGELSHNGSAMAWALTNLASISLAVADIPSAAQYADRAAALFGSQADRYGLAVSRELQGGIAAALENIPEARATYRDVLERYQAGGFGSGTYSAQVSLAHLAMREHDWASARRNLEGASRAAKRYGMGAVQAELAYFFGTLALRQGNLSGAGRQLSIALGAASATQASLRYATGARLAEVFARRGDLARAGRELTAAVDRFDAWRAALSDRELRLLAFQIAAAEEEPDLGVPFVIARLASGGQVAAAFHVAERLHARALFDQMARADALRERAADTLAARTSSWSDDRDIALERIAAALPDDSTALAEFVTGTDSAPSTVFVITRHEQRAVVLPPSVQLASAVARFNVLLESGADPRALGRTLGAALLDPVLAPLPPSVARLIVVPDGALHRLPFDALVLADGRYVVEHFAVSLVPSAAVALRLWQRVPRTDEPRLLALGDPTFARAPAPTQGPATQGFSSGFAAHGGLERLPASAVEATAVAQYAVAPTVLLREQASAAWLKRHPLTPYRVLHFATHALVDDAALTQTALALAPGDGEDGFLGPGDLARLQLAADLVVLSSCRTAGGVVLHGEGLQGLTAPLLAAGARSVAVTWWPIGDRRALQVIEVLYRALAAGRPVTAALQAAKLTALHGGAPAREWAAFTLAGDPFVRVPLHAPAARWPPIWLLGTRSPLR